jgi:penicillin-binding protein 1A
MKQALAEQPAIPFRVPPGIKLVRVSLKTGLRASPDDPNAIMEAFKPNEEPDDAYSVIGFSDATTQSNASGGGNWQQGPSASPGYGSNASPGGMW